VGIREQLSEFLVPFEVAVAESGARGLMSSYTQVDGIPNCADAWAMTDLLRERWGFKGWVIADDGAVHDLLNQHNTSATPAEAITTWMEAGGAVTYYGFPQAEVYDVIVNVTLNGTMDGSVLDARVTDLLTVKHELGLFEDPFVDVNTLIEANVDTPAARQLSEVVSQEALILLKNTAPNATAVLAPASDGPLRQARQAGLEAAQAPTDPTSAAGALLPISLDTTTKIFVTGPNADTVRTGDYSGSGRLQNFVTVLDGIRSAVDRHNRATASGSAILSYLPGCFVQAQSDWPTNFPNTVTIRPAFLSTASSTSGDGLVGSYYQQGADPASPDASPVFTRVDEAVDFRWFVYGPNAFQRTAARTGNATGINTALFSARWDGFLTSPVTVNGRISMFTDGNPIRVVLDGTTVIDTFPSDGRSAESPSGCGLARLPHGVACSELCECASYALEKRSGGGAAEAVPALSETMRSWRAPGPARARCKGPTRAAAEAELARLGPGGLDAVCERDAAAPSSAAQYSFVAGRPISISVQFKRIADTRAQSILEWSLLPGGGLNETEGIAAAARSASMADVAVVVVGQNDATVGEGIDSGTLALPGRQEELVQAIAATGTPVVTVVAMGQPLVLNSVADYSSAVIASFFNGQAYGSAVADALFGVTSPAGRLPSSLPGSVGQLPVFYSQFATGRQDYVNGPAASAFPFGFGLSYTTFAYEIVGTGPVAPRVSDATLNVTVRVTNTGAVTSDDVVQIYVRDVVASVATPLRRLVAFDRIKGVEPGASITLTLPVDVGLELSVFNRKMERVVEPGLFLFWAAGCSDSTRCVWTDATQVTLAPAA
jgi:hypothetical protein